MLHADCRYAVELPYVGSVRTVSCMRWNYARRVRTYPKNPGVVHPKGFIPILVMRRIKGVFSFVIHRPCTALSNSTRLPLLFFRPVFLDTTDNQQLAPFFQNTLFGAESDAATSWLNRTHSACLYRGLPDASQEPRTTRLMRISSR